MTHKFNSVDDKVKNRSMKECQRQVIAENCNNFWKVKVLIFSIFSDFYTTLSRTNLTRGTSVNAVGKCSNNHQNKLKKNQNSWQNQSTPPDDDTARLQLHTAKEIFNLYHLSLWNIYCQNLRNFPHSWSFCLE